MFLCSCVSVRDYFYPFPDRQVIGTPLFSVSAINTVRHFCHKLIPLPPEYSLRIKANKMFDAVITTGKQHEISWCYHPKPVVLTDSGGLPDCADKKYDPNPLLSVLKDTTQYSKVAFAGLACHVQPVRKLQCAAQAYRDILPTFAKAADKLTRNIDFVIGIGDIGRFGKGKIDVLLQEFGVNGEKEVTRHLEESSHASIGGRKISSTVLLSLQRF